MRSEQHGINTSVNEVTSIGEAGFWLLADDREYFVPFADYPVFKNATVEQIFRVERIAPGHYSWPLLDADIELEALEQPEKFPLIYR
jgi:hypothetical protein